jgi:N-acetylmuramoyl-L-alanine amidase
MIDAAHGGSESGAVLNPSLTEKDITLSIARRLRQELASRGIPSPLVRDADATVTTDQRAAAVNSAHPALYISIHATSQGKGIRIYSALLPAENDGNRGPFVDWQIAQSAALTRSRWMQSQIFASLQKTGFPVRTLTAPLRPLTNITVPALSIEIAPTTGDVAQLASADYQLMISAALSNSIALLRYKLETEPGP